MILCRHRAFLRLMCLGIFMGALISACTQRANNNEKNAKECEAFIIEQRHLYSEGKILKAWIVISKIDSFYAGRQNIDPFSLFIKYSLESRFYNELGKYDSSKLLADTALNIMEQNKLQKKYAADYINAITLKGDILYATNHFSQAYNYYFKAKQLADQVKDTCVLYGYSYGLAMISYRQKNYTDATEYFKLAFGYLTRCKAYPTYQLQRTLMISHFAMKNGICPTVRSSITILQYHLSIKIQKILEKKKRTKHLE